ncbi:hypothetical protein C2E23DRAFT_224999 [Lenzites betulinus]|nr:hypothetical protein C2E23DRAFT_224999 [Lenzites betulinus]
MEPPASTAALAKIPLLLSALWAHRISYSSPTPFVAKKPDGKEGEMTGCVRMMRPPWLRKASKTATRIVMLGEAVAILAKHSPSLASAYATVARGGAEHLRITPTFAVGWALVMAGGLLRWACYRTMGKHFTFEVTIHEDHHLVTSGPYSIVRHPSYTGMVMVVLGTIVSCFSRGSLFRESGILGTPWGKLFAAAWVADMLYVPVVMVFLRVKAEDGILRKQFGREWDKWAKTTPYALFPGIY